MPQANKFNIEEIESTRKSRVKLRGLWKNRLTITIVVTYSSTFVLHACPWRKFILHHLL